MAHFARTTRILMAGTACMLLASCDGADSVASPGEGVIVVPTTPAPTPAPTATPTPAPGTPAASCPAGLADAGVVGNYRGCRLPSNITSDLRLQKLAGVAYEISGPTNVGVDLGGGGDLPTGRSAVLTIEPGVLLYANTTNADNDYLIVNRGSRIFAEGSPTQPIIFTAQQNLTGGVTDESQGLWGGVILAGRAPISNCNTAVTGGAVNCENRVEGTSPPASYGGNAPTDSSGTFRYVQIRYSGTIISPDNELQGLTLGGTGSGTTIDHVQIHNSSDDGIEVFGGRTNMRYLAITGADDDGLDTDVGWQGQVQFLLTVQKPNSKQGDNYSTEIDSNGNEDALPRQRYNLANFTFVQTSSATNAAIRLRGGADARFVNGIVVSPTACLNIIAGIDASGKSTIRPANPGLEDNGPPMFDSVLFSCGGASPYAETTVNGVTVTLAEQRTVFTAGTNNVENGTGLLNAGSFLPAGIATTATPFNAATLNPANTSFFVQTSFVGAVSGPNDTNFAGWTCNSNRASFGSTSGSCTGLPN